MIFRVSAGDFAGVGIFLRVAARFDIYRLYPRGFAPRTPRHPPSREALRRDLAEARRAEAGALARPVAWGASLRSRLSFFERQVDESVYSRVPPVPARGTAVTSAISALVAPRGREAPTTTVSPTSIVKLVSMTVDRAIRSLAPRAAPALTAAVDSTRSRSSAASR